MQPTETTSTASAHQDSLDDLPAYLYDMRKRAGLSQYALAAILKCTNEAISLAERGKGRPSDRKIKAWAQACGAKLAYTYTPKAEPERNPLDAAYELLPSGIPHGTVIYIHHVGRERIDGAVSSEIFPALHQKLVSIGYESFLSPEFAVDHVNATLRHIPADDNSKAE